MEEIQQSGDDEATALKKFVLSSKLILRKDSSFDLVMLKQYIHGSWHYDKESKNIFHSYGLSYKIRKLRPQFT